MRIALFVFTLVVFTALVPAVFAAEEDPFVRNGRVVATIVVGQDAPATDVILGAEIAAYLQTFASRSTTGLATTHDQVYLADGGVYILIGTPEDNPLVQEALGMDANPSFDGPFLRLDDDIMIISGDDAAAVEAATLAFRRGTRSLGDVTGQEDDDADFEPPVEDETDDDWEDVPTSPPFPPVTPPTAEPAPDQDPSCTPTQFCSGRNVMFRSADCSEEILEYCAYGCKDGSCAERGLKSFWSTFWDALTFWD